MTRYECTRCGFSAGVARIAGCGRPFEGDIVTACPMAPVDHPKFDPPPVIMWAAILALTVATIYLIF